MVWRITENELRNLIETDADVSLVQFINIANRLTDRVQSNDTGSILSDDELRDIEVNLAAHFYQSSRDRSYSSMGAGRSSASYQGQTGMYLTSTDPGQNAVLLDATGYLSRLNQSTRPKAGAFWLGKRPSQQTDYEDRD